MAVKRALDWALRCWGNGEIDWHRESISLPFHLIGFNDVGIVGMPNEAWCEIGIAVKQATAPLVAISAWVATAFVLGLVAFNFIRSGMGAPAKG